MLGNAKSKKDSDCALMLSFAAGDSEGFELLYRRHSQSVYRFFFFGTHGDRSLASELFQDVWMTVVRGRARYTNEINFTDWLFHSAWARLHDHLRLHPLETSTTQEENNAPAPSSVVQFDAFANKTKVKDDAVIESPDTKSAASGVCFEDEEPATAETLLVESISKMNPEHKEVALLRYCFFMTNSDIAEFLDMPQSVIDRTVRESASVIRNDISTEKSSDCE